MSKELNIEYNDFNKYLNIDEKGNLCLDLTKIEIVVGKTEIEFEEILDEEGRPTGLFTELLIQEYDEDETEKLKRLRKKNL